MNLKENNTFKPLSPTEPKPEFSDDLDPLGEQHRQFQRLTLELSDLRAWFADLSSSEDLPSELLAAHQLRVDAVTDEMMTVCNRMVGIPATCCRGLTYKAAALRHLLDEDQDPATALALSLCGDLSSPRFR